MCVLQTKLFYLLSVDVPKGDKPPGGLITETINSVLEDIQCVESRLSDMTQKLSRTIGVLSGDKTTCTEVGKQASVDTHSAAHVHVTPHTEGHEEGEETFRGTTVISADQHLSQSDPDTETNLSAQGVKTNPRDTASLFDASHSEDGISSLVGGSHSSDSTATQLDLRATGQQPETNSDHHTGRKSPSTRDPALVSEHIRPPPSGVR